MEPALRSIATSEATTHEEEQLNVLREEFREFVYRVSHDVHAPLRSILSFSELLERKYGEKILDPEARDCLMYIRKGVLQAREMLTALLEYSRINTLSNPPTEMDCNLVIERCVNRYRKALEKSGGTITTDLLPALICEAKQIEKLFSVLIENAMKFRDKDRALEIHITVKALAQSWMIGVSDNGIGIAPEHQEEIFLPFRSIHTSEEHAGLGMGLALARKIVHHHRGQIWVESEPGQSSAFYFTLPADDHLLKEGLI